MRINLNNMLVCGKCGKFTAHYEGKTRSDFPEYYVIKCREKKCGHSSLTLYSEEEAKKQWPNQCGDLKKGEKYIAYKQGNGYYGQRIIGTEK